MYKGISVVRPGAHLGDIGEIIQKHAEKNGFRWSADTAAMASARCSTRSRRSSTTVVRVPEHRAEGRHDLHHRADDHQGRQETRLLGDGWTAITKDRKLSAQWEHTVLVTADGYEILTLRNDETFPRAPRQPDPPGFAASRAPRRPPHSGGAEPLIRRNARTNSAKTHKTGRSRIEPNR